MKNESDGLTFYLNASKRIQNLNTTIKGGLKTSASHYQYLIQRQMMPVTRSFFSANLGVDTRIRQIVLISYAGAYQQYISEFDKTSPSDIRTMNHQLTTNFLLGKHIIVRADLSYYYNDCNEGPQKNLCFINAGISYRAGKLEYAINANNLLNTKRYSSTTFSTNTIYSMSYELRPTSVIVSVRFSLR